MQTFIKNLQRRLVDVRLILDLACTVFSYFWSAGLVVALAGFPSISSDIVKFLPFYVLVRGVSLIYFKTHRSFWRYFSAYDAISFLKAVGASALVLFLLQYKLSKLNLSILFFISEMILFSTFAFSIRLARRIVFEKLQTNRIYKYGRRTLIYGAGEKGRELAHRFNTDPSFESWLVGFIDDDSAKANALIPGVTVLGTGDQLADIFKAYAIQELVIADSNLPGHRLKKTLQIARSSGVRPKMISDLGLKAQESRKFEIFRDVELSDLLNRPRVAVDLNSVKDLVEQKTVLVTGGGGSIGGELVKQIAENDPKILLILDHSEYNLYLMEQDLKSAYSRGLNIVLVLLDLKDRASLGALMKKYRPEIIFHAAAYKHVHLVEANPCAAILNNIGGTKNLIDLSLEVGTETFVQISTDKAVNPVGVMGATKRVCELMIECVASESRKKYCAVRFGNVIGSSGSFIPLLKKQIRNGGPVTITHQDMVRYFMLIPEAVSLVLKAASISSPGDINILKMGEPIRILDIAKNLIVLLGRTEDEVPIVFTGLRPGEKMKEELYLCGDEVQTEHPDIVILPGGASADKQVKQHGRGLSELLAEILKMAAHNDPEAVSKLMLLAGAHDRLAVPPLEMVA